jgi:Kef-type K+ transport system membrane component KefB
MPFLVQALVYLGAAVISVPIAKRLGLGSVLGYLIAGVVIGPFALSLVGEQTDIMNLRRVRRGDPAVPDRAGGPALHPVGHA